jgi:hypothetical protein
MCTTEDMDVFSKDMEQLSELRLASAEKSPCSLDVMLPAVLLASEEEDASDNRPEVLIQKELPLLLVIREIADFSRIIGGLDDMVSGERPTTIFGEENKMRNLGWCSKIWIQNSGR